MPRPIEIRDLGKIKYVGDPQISPDGSMVAYVVTEADIAGKKYQSSIWLAATDGSWNRRFTQSKSKDSAPRWSPDGRKLAFLSDRAEKSQIFVVPLDGGESQQITDLKNGVAELTWSPDGSRVAFSSKIGSEGPVSLSKQTPEERKRDEEKSDVKVIRSLRFKLDGEGFLGDLKRHIFTVPAEGGDIEQVTTGDWDDAQPGWSHDGSHIAFVSNRTDDREFNRVADIWTVDVARGDCHQLTKSDGQYMTPAFSPDGTQIAYVGNPLSKEYGPNTMSALWVQSLDGGEPKNISRSVDRDISGTAISDAHYVAPAQIPVWTRDGSAIVVNYADRGNVPVARFTLGGEVKTLVNGQREILNFSMANDGTLALLISDTTHPFEVFVAGADGGNERQLSHANDDFLAEISMAEVKSFTVTTTDGVEIDSWLLMPPGFDESRKYPLILEIHGGPHAMYGNSFYHELQVYAAQGYAVLYCNPRGSTGGGQQFLNAAAGDWGGVDYQDIMAVVDHVAAFPDIDASRLGVTGGSYGGYMTNWIITQTDRFKAAVTQRSTCNRHNLWGTSDLVWSYASWEFSGTAYERPEYYLERSPLSYVQNVKTPTMIMHSENDLRCPIEQGEQWFVALKLHGVETEFIRFPNESHGLSRTGRPDRRVERLERAVDWFDRYM